MELKFRKLKPQEIDVRVGSVSRNGNGASFLLYKDARCDMNILDETVGAFNWQRSHSRENANCTVSIYDEKKGIWVSKEDTGTESFTEKEKGLASDSFKRACFNWGIGRELYTAPFIWVSSDKINITEFNGKKQVRDNLSVSKVDYDSSGNIVLLEIKNDKGKVVYSYGNSYQSTNKTNSHKATDKQIDLIESLYSDVELDTMLTRMGKGLPQLTVEEASTMISARKGDKK